MKNIILVFLLLSNLFVFAQKKTLKTKEELKKNQSSELDNSSITILTEKDFIVKSDTIFSSKKIYVKDANDDLILTKFDFFAIKSKLDYLTIKTLNSILHKCNNDVMLDTKNKYTYTPKKIGIYFIESQNRWSINIEYTAQNDFGATKNGKCFFRYSFDGFFYDKYYL
jgi:hypothetical protein